MSRPIRRTYGGGFDPVIFRWNFSHPIKRMFPYFEMAGGSLITAVNFPVGDTSSINFSVRGGGGVHIFTTCRRSLDLGCYWLHISNANLGTRNPEFNGIQVRLGHHWFK